MTISARTRNRRLREQNDEYAWCKTFGHSWEVWNAGSRRRPQFGYYESVYCPRCTTERHFTIDLNGDVISRRYVYPPDYRLGYRLSRAEARRELRKRGWFDEKARAQARELAAV